MTRSVESFARRYGPWALVAGASEGLGAAFSTELARRGLHLVLVARRDAPLRVLADRLTNDHGVHVEALPLDLGRADAVGTIAAVVGEREIGLVVANAAHAPIGPLVGVDERDLDLVIDVNCRTPLRLARTYLPGMAARGRGGFVIMASMAGLQGGPGLAAYSATKAFELVLAEGLWHELRHDGVDVIASCAGAIATPNLGRAMSRRAPGTLSPERVVTDTLAALGRGPRVVPGGTNRVGAFVLGHLVGRRTAVRTMARAAAGLSEAPPA